MTIYRVSVFTHMGKFLKSFGKKGKLKGGFDLPHGVVTDMNTAIVRLLAAMI